MRLTLRTLLAWMDGVLPPDELRQLGERVAGCGAATQLAGRIRDAVGSGSLDGLRVDAWGTADDPNLVAEFLDNRLTGGQLAAMERTCLESDAHLAEVGACHAMLAELVRGARGEGLAGDESVTRLKLRMRGALPVPPRERDTIAAAAASQAIAAVRRPHFGGHLSAESSAAVAVPGGIVRSDVTAASRRAAVPAAAQATAAVSPAAVPPGIAATHPTSRGMSGGEASSAHVHRQPDRESRRGKKKPGAAAADAARSERIIAAGSFFALAAVGALLVTWVSTRGLSRGPDRASLQGQVSLDGKPLESGVIVLVPSGDTQGPTAGGTLSDGKFHIAADGGPVAGRYRVQIKATRKTGRMVKSSVPIGNRREVEETEQFIPARYNTASELEVEIKPGRNRMTFDLKSPPQSDSRPGGRGPQQRLATERPVSPRAGAAAVSSRGKPSG